MTVCGTHQQADRPHSREQLRRAACGVGVFAIAALLASPPLAAGQDTREGTISNAQAEKAKALAPYKNRAEEVLSRTLNMLTLPPNGFYPVFGSVYSGGGF